MHSQDSKRLRRSNLNSGVRDVIRGSPHRVVGQLAWVKGRRRTNVPWESRPERDAARILAADSRVLTLEAQPFVVNYRIDGHAHKYTPDYRVGHRTKPFILEVKEFAEASKPENQERFAAIAEVLAEEGSEFKVWTESEYRRQPLLSNSNYVLRFRNYPYEEAQAEKVALLLAKQRSLPASVIANELGSDFSPLLLFALVCAGIIHVDCDRLLGVDPVFHEVPSNG